MPGVPSRGSLTSLHPLMRTCGISKVTLATFMILCGHRTSPSGARRRRPSGARAIGRAVWRAVNRKARARRRRAGAALIAPGLPMASVPTGMPAGICRIDSRLSLPSRAWVFIGTPNTGSDVSERGHAGQVSGAAGTRDHHLEALLARGFSELEQPVRRPVRRHDQRLEADAELGQRIGGMLHGLPVGLASHDDRNRLPRHRPPRSAQKEARRL